MPILRLPKGHLRDEIRQPLYDTITIAAAESPIATRYFFQTVTGKSKAQTNLKQNSQLETAVSFRCQGVSLDAQNMYWQNRLALPLIQENSSLRLRVGEKDYWEGPMTFLSGRIRHEAYSNATDVAYQHFGLEAVQPVILRGKHVVDINPLQSFFIEWICSGMTAAEITSATPAAGTQLKFLASLKGLLRRPVQ
jgi:hypothetical protein